MLNLRFDVSMLKKRWQGIVERYRRVSAELRQIEFEMAKENGLKPPPLLFPKRPYKAGTIALFCIFGFFAAFAAWVCLKELMTAFLR